MSQEIEIIIVGLKRLICVEVKNIIKEISSEDCVL